MTSGRRPEKLLNAPQSSASAGQERDLGARVMALEVVQETQAANARPGSAAG